MHIRTTKPPYKMPGVLKIQSLVSEIIAGLLIMLFVYTALSKAMHYAKFQSSIIQASVISSFAPVAWVLPLSELVIALLLFIPRTRRKGLWASLIVLILLTSYLGYMLLFTEDLPCNCGGVIEQFSWKQHIGFNMVFIGLSIIGVHSQPKAQPIKRKEASG